MLVNGYRGSRGSKDRSRRLSGEKSRFELIVAVDLAGNVNTIVRERVVDTAL